MSSGLLPESPIYLRCIRLDLSYLILQPFSWLYGVNAVPAITKHQIKYFRYKREALGLKYSIDPKKVRRIRYKCNLYSLCFAFVRVFTYRTVSSINHI